ncbi:MAG: hypothetical protein MUO77_15745 [Anaerolineales bacterium]|nr:hypothetical protein [Anaerolineales bacterium]
MLPRFSLIMYRLARGPVTLAALVIFLLFVSLVMPKQAAQAETYSRDAGSPDMSFFYSADDLYRMADSYGEAGRAAYVRARFTFDVIWPIVYLFFLGTSLSWALVRALSEGNHWRMLNLFPAFGWLFDLLENIAASAVMLNFPSHIPVVDLLTPIFTSIKWFFVGGSFVILVPAFLVAVWRVIQSRK